MPQAATLHLLSCEEPNPKCALSGSLSALQLHSLPSLSSWTALLSSALLKAPTITPCSFSVLLHLLQLHCTVSLYCQPLLPRWFSWMCSVLAALPSKCLLPSLCALIQGSSSEQELKDNSSPIKSPQHFPALVGARVTAQLDKQAEAGPKEALPGVRLSDCFPCTKCWPQPCAL